MRTPTAVPAARPVSPGNMREMEMRNAFPAPLENSAVMLVSSPALPARKAMHWRSVGVRAPRVLPVSSRAAMFFPSTATAAATVPRATSPIRRAPPRRAPRAQRGSTSARPARPCAATVVLAKSRPLQGIQHAAVVPPASSRAVQDRVLAATVRRAT